jgi:hypothetical protein
VSFSTWAQRWEWPSTKGPARDARTLLAIRQGDFIVPTFQPIVLTGAGHTAQIMVGNDALRVGAPGDSVRVIVTPEIAQAISDLMGWYGVTAKVDDAIALQSDRFIDFAETIGGTQDPNGQPYSDTAHMVEHSAKLDELTDGETWQIVGGGWKEWINSPRLLLPQTLTYGKQGAINYGYFSTGPSGAGGKNPWPSATAPSLRVWQPPGGVHDVHHVDVSQKYRPLGPLAWVEGPLHPDGAWYDLADLSLHPILWPLLNHDGPQPMRHPWLPKCSPIDEGGSCPGIPGPTGGGGDDDTPPPTVAARYDWGRTAPLAACIMVGAVWIGTGR